MLNKHHMECRLARMLSTAQLEIIPLRGIVDRILADIPGETTLTITCSPRHGIQRTVETAELLVESGYNVIPHIAASAVRSRRQLADIAIRLADLGVSEVFVIGGDGQTGQGVFPSALELIAELAELQCRPSRIGVAGYPEGHPDIPDALLLKALQRKAEYADYIVPQMCFAPSALRNWLTGLSEAEVELPVVLSAPGAVKRRKLIEMSPRIGVGNSVRYLSKNRKTMAKLLLRRTYTPEVLLEEVMADDVAAARVTGLHIFTFNQLVETDQWRSRQCLAWQRSARNAVPGATQEAQGLSCCFAGETSGATSH